MLPWGHGAYFSFPEHFARLLRVSLGLRIGQRQLRVTQNYLTKYPGHGAPNAAYAPTVLVEMPAANSISIDLGNLHFAPVRVSRAPCGRSSAWNTNSHQSIRNSPTRCGKGLPPETGWRKQLLEKDFLNEIVGHACNVKFRRKIYYPSSKGNIKHPNNYTPRRSSTLIGL